MRRPGCFRGPWSSWHFACRQFARKTIDLSVRFIPSHFVEFFLVSQRSGRPKPTVERSALYSIYECSVVFASAAVVVLVLLNANHVFISNRSLYKCQASCFHIEPFSLPIEVSTTPSVHRGSSFERDTT